MSDYKHPSKSKFYEILEFRLSHYEEAIFPIRIDLGMKTQMYQAKQYGIEQLKRIDLHINLFGTSFWGYGINAVSDGKETFSHLDVEDIKKTGGLNKHLEDYRIFLLLVFKIEKDALIVSLFSIDTCRIMFNSNSNTRYDLRKFENAEMRIRNGKIFVDFIFNDVKNPISFQIESYHIGGGHLNRDELAKYYIDNITRLSNAVKIEDKLLSAETALEADLNNQIEKVERALRLLIADVLIHNTGIEDFEKLLTGKPKQNIKARVKEHVDKHPGSTIEDFRSLTKCIQFLDIDDLRQIISKDHYWPYFEYKFKSKDHVDRHFMQFNDIRKAKKHFRDISKVNLYSGKASMEWLELAIK